MTQYADKLSAGYRSDGLRAWKEVNGVRTYFLYAGGQLLAELDDTGTLKTSYTYGPTGLLNRTNLQTNQETWYLFDPQGNVATRLDASGQVLSTDQYDAWGNLLSGGDTTGPSGYRAQFGYYTDHETGLILCGHRYYDPAAGRWLTRDPIGIAGGLNVYGYCGGDPVSFTDPWGLCWDRNRPYDAYKDTGPGLLNRDTLGNLADEYAARMAQVPGGPGRDPSLPGYIPPEARYADGINNLPKELLPPALAAAAALRAKNGKGGDNEGNGPPLKITEFSKHGMNQAITREIKTSSILDAVRNPKTSYFQKNTGNWAYIDPVPKSPLFRPLRNRGDF